MTQHFFRFHLQGGVRAHHHRDRRLPHPGAHLIKPNFEQKSFKFSNKDLSKKFEQFRTNFEQKN
jgi:hypothetical protein